MRIFFILFSISTLLIVSLTGKKEKNRNNKEVIQTKLKQSPMPFQEKGMGIASDLHIKDSHTSEAHQKGKAYLKTIPPKTVPLSVDQTPSVNTVTTSATEGNNQFDYEYSELIGNRLDEIIKRQNSGDDPESIQNQLDFLVYQHSSYEERLGYQEKINKISEDIEYLDSKDSFTYEDSITYQ